MSAEWLLSPICRRRRMLSLTLIAYGLFDILPPLPQEHGQTCTPCHGSIQRGCNFRFLQSNGDDYVLLAELAKPPTLTFPDWDAVDDGYRHPLYFFGVVSTDAIGATFEQKQKHQVGSIRRTAFTSCVANGAQRCGTETLNIPIQTQRGECCSQGDRFFEATCHHEKREVMYICHDDILQERAILAKTQHSRTTAVSQT